MDDTPETPQAQPATRKPKQKFPDFEDGNVPGNKIEVRKGGALVPKEDYDLTFRDRFNKKVKRKAMKAVDVLTKVMIHSKSDVAKVAAAKAIMDKAVPTESQVNIDVNQVSYLDTLRALNERMRAATPIVVHDIEIIPPKQIKGADGE